MMTEQKKKIIFLIIAIIMFGMVPVYYYTMLRHSDFEKWGPVFLFLVSGVVCLVNCFIIQMKQAQQNNKSIYKPKEEREVAIFILP